jgi:hypothetical protein
LQEVARRGFIRLSAAAGKATLRRLSGEVVPKVRILAR